MRLSDRVAIVTGAQQGIGKAIALAYGREGAGVVVNYLDDAAVFLAAEDSRQMTGQTLHVNGGSFLS